MHFRTMGKRALSILLCTLMLLAVLPITTNLTGVAASDSNGAYVSLPIAHSAQ